MRMRRKTPTNLTALMLAAAFALAALPAQARILSLRDADTLFCAQVYAETERAFRLLPDADARALADEAGKRAVPMSQRESDLLNETPELHARAAALVQRRLAALPAGPEDTRRMALRSAFESCRDIEDGARAEAAETDRAELLGNRRFCRDLMLRKASVSPAQRAQFGRDGQATLEEMQRIGQALAQPLPGRPILADEDRKANEVQAIRRRSLEMAIATWKRGEDPLVRELGLCHKEYAKGLLGGPNVLTPAAAPTVPAASAATLPPADLGAVFHMRETLAGASYEGIWRRRDDTSSLYDGYWVHMKTGQVQKDVLEVRGIDNGELVIHRQGSDTLYRAPVRADGSLGPGQALLAGKPAYQWRALPAQSVRGADLGAVLHVREQTAGGDYDGIWRRRGRSNVYDAFWVHLPSGETLSDIVVVQGLRKGFLELQRPAVKGVYRARPGKDGRLAGGTAQQGDGPAHDWTVLPAQPGLPATAAQR
jgi:hypothetical protein